MSERIIKSNVSWDRQKFERLRGKLADARGEAASTNERLSDEIRKGQQETSKQLSEILSRMDTYGKRKSFF
ncbi:hypothetical protein A3844_10185 [Paenibacillus helianthi]|uniref:CsbD family protein n=1 Tax=Paenibacillus helianthi TaxID=1349432 RepID=A0ABX3ETG7_9BACL|nr:hypothetical protein [Paenibacillus sp. P32E]OKP87765.1 hypothetical protein A3844_10185 [Paenibacillus helianthi]OKP93429.1 hypothetical protein A3848_05515 [Paenibacillus sp. P32E]